MMMIKRKQSGFVLVLTLIIMVALSLISIPAMRSANINMQIINNEMNRDILQSQVNRAIEQMVNDASGTTYKTPVVSTLTIDGQVIMVGKPECISSKVASGDSVSIELPKEDTIWEVVAQGTSSKGSRVTIVQGLKIQMTKDSCV